jgi:hypothetical protein
LNPRVLSNMGLAIPRPTRLGDPRAINRDLSIILSLGMIIFKPSYSSCVNQTLHTSHVTMGSGQSKSGLVCDCIFTYWIKTFGTSITLPYLESINWANFLAGLLYPDLYFDFELLAANLDHPFNIVA